MSITRRGFLKTSVAAGALANVPGFLLKPNNAYAWVQSPSLQKFIRRLPMLITDIPVLTPDKTTYPGVDYYQILMHAFQQWLHPQLPGATMLYGYSNAVTPVKKHLGGVIIAHRGTPVRIKFTNMLPRKHILPVDITVPETGQRHNRAAVHLHGGKVPWVSDGGPFHWSTPDGVVGPSVVKWLPDKTGALTDDHYYPNTETARMMWYHDHAVGLTRLNAYAGLASAYIVRDNVEKNLIKPNGTGLPQLAELGGREIPLIFQDKTFKQVADAWGQPGDLWYPDTYDPARWPIGPGGVPPYPSTVPEFSGDTMLVNGIAYPFLDVQPRRYRFRMLNANQTRFLRMQMYVQDATADGITLGATGLPTNKPGPIWVQIGTEGGFLDGTAHPKGVRLSRLLLAPAERADVIVDFSMFAAGTRIILYNDAPSPFPAGDPRNDYYPGNPSTPMVTPGFGPHTRTLMQFRVIPLVGVKDPPLALTLPPASPPLLAPVGVLTPPPGVPVRDLTLNEDFDNLGRLIQRIGTTTKLYPGTYARNYLDSPTEIVERYSVEVWRIFNLSADSHPIHFHLANVQIISRQKFQVKGFNPAAPVFTAPAVGPAANEVGWKETVTMNPNQCTTVIMRFTLPPAPAGVTVPFSPRLKAMGITGYEYVYHCHILEHEEHDMMRPLVVL